MTTQQDNTQATTKSDVKVIAYVRISDAGKQDSATQRDVIAKYADEQSLSITEWREFHGSGSKLTAAQRGIDELLQSVGVGDKVIVSDIARLGRDNMHAVVNTITTITGKGATLCFAYSKTELVANEDIGALFMAVGEAWAAVKFAEERSKKAKAAAQRRRESGLQNGRKKGAVIKSKLDEHAVFIMKQLDAGVSKLAILRLLDERGVKVARSRFYTWLDTKLGGKGIEKRITS